MILRTVLFLSCVTYSSAFAFANNPDSIGGYIPGESASFLFKLPSVSDLGSYNIELLLHSSTGVAGTDFYFDSVASIPAATGYVFASSTDFFASANVLTGNRHSLTLSDFSDSGVNVVTGVNDAIATVVFRTSATFSGVLSLSLVDETFQLDTPATTPTSVLEFESARSMVSDAVNVTVLPVPEPATLPFLTLGFIWACARPKNSTRKH